MNILVLNGPNLNLLGKREKNIYGEMSLEQIINYTETKLPTFYRGSVKLKWLQSNLEGELINLIQKLIIEEKQFDALIINPAGLTHSSVPLYDLLSILEIPVIEVHLSNLFKREDFRSHQLITTKASSEVLVGGKEKVYILAILSLILKGKC